MPVPVRQPGAVRFRALDSARELENEAKNTNPLQISNLKLGHMGYRGHGHGARWAGMGTPVDLGRFSEQAMRETTSIDRQTDREPKQQQPCC